MQTRECEFPYSIVEHPLGLWDDVVRVGCIQLGHDGADDCARGPVGVLGDGSLGDLLHFGRREHVLGLVPDADVHDGDDSQCSDERVRTETHQPAPR